MIGCSNESVEKTNFFIHENGKDIYYNCERYNDMLKDIDDFKEIINNIVKSFNEVINGRRNVNYINQMASEELLDKEEYNSFSKIIPQDTELKIKSSKVTTQKIHGLVYDKDKNVIKVYVKIESEENNKNGIITVANNQTYIFSVKEEGMTLIDYHLSQFIKE